jgi:putative transposase
MPRRGRIMLAGIPAHVRQRGNNRAPCFLTDEDRKFYLLQLGRSLGRYGCELHAYCLMTNHVHLLLTPKRAESCALLMKHMGQLHSQYFNKLYGRTGSLWEGRFRSCLVQSEGYLLTCYCYVELNPVNAGMVGHAEDYAWSSYRENALGGPSSGLLTPHAEYLRVGASAYADLVRTIAPQHERLNEIRAATKGGYALGTKEFRDAMARALGRRVEQGKPGRPRRAQNENQEQTTLFTTSDKKNVVCP